LVARFINLQSLIRSKIRTVYARDAELLRSYMWSVHVY